MKLTAHLTIVFLLTCTLSSRAQLNPLQDIYYQNRYLANPAMAGLDQGLRINLGYRQQWNSFPGAPKSQLLTADYQALDRVGVGLNITDDQAGLIRQTRIMGTYAYHLPLSDNNQKLNFGLSLGVNDGRIDPTNIVGDENDLQLAEYNQTKPYVDGDFGIAYTSDNLFIEGTIPNLKAAFFGNSSQQLDADRTLFITAISYKFYMQDKNENSGLVLEPLVALRGIKGFTNVVDAGLSTDMRSYNLALEFVYHSNHSLGSGVVYRQPDYEFSFHYNLETGQISNYTTGALELGLKVKLFKTGNK